MNHDGVVFDPFLTAKILLTGDTPHCQVPGGFGAVGQPNDGWHQCHHSLARSFASFIHQVEQWFWLTERFQPTLQERPGINSNKASWFSIEAIFVETSRLLQVGPRRGILSVVNWVKEHADIHTYWQSDLLLMYICTYVFIYIYILFL